MRPPASSVSAGRPATGQTSSDDPTTSSSAASRASRVARSIASAGSTSPNMTTSGLRTAAQSAQRGSGSNSRTRASGSRWPQARQPALRIDPCTSIASREPARSCSVSMFCVTTARTRPARSSAAIARCAAFGSAFVSVS
jgi:hypothetical protein